MGRDYYADDVAKILNCGEETARQFFLAFIRGVSSKMYAEYVYVPELNKVEVGYRRSGLPGCVGSMDCTHVVWDRAAKKVNNTCKRSGKAATLSFEVVVDHVLRSFSGSSKDKHVMFHDTYLYDLSFGTTQFGRKPSGKVHGLLWTMGIPPPQYFSLQCPDHHAMHHDEALFVEWLEFMRKDIEWTFGILKQRFRILKNPIRLYFEDDIDDVVRTSAVMHIILLEFDGFLNLQ